MVYISLEPAKSLFVPFDGHQLPRFIALAHQHAAVGAVPQLLQSGVAVHPRRIMQLPPPLRRNRVQLTTCLASPAMQLTRTQLYTLS